MSSFKEIRVFRNRFEADFAKNILEEEGIKAMISADDCGGLRPDLSLTTGGVRLLVNQEDVERANELLNSLNK